MKRLLIWVLAGVVLAPLAARADVTIETKSRNKTQTVYLTPHMLSAMGDEGGAIFRGDKQVLYVIEPKEKTYREITKEDADALGSKMNDAMAKMQEAMKNMPPEQRAMVENMMKSKMSAAPAEGKRTVKATGEQKTINGFDCSGYVVTQDGGMTTEVWAADPKSAHLKPEDLSVFKDLGDFIKVMTPRMGGFADMIKDYEHPKESDVPGIPILTIHKGSDGKESWR